MILTKGVEMRNTWFVAALVAAMASVVSAESIKGEYLEARNADVWTGPCFANGEMNIVGNKAIMAWKVTAGSREGVSLDGLGVAAVVIADRTLGIHENAKTKALLLVDERATSKQRAALVALASELAGKTIQKVVGVESVKFAMETNACSGLGCASLQAGKAKVQTRCLCKEDSICGHEDLYYPTLAKVAAPRAAYALANEYTGKVFGETFRDNNARSAVIGTFAR